MQCTIYKLINDDDVIAMVEQSVDGNTIHDPRYIAILPNDDGTLRVELAPFTFFSTEIPEFLSEHVLFKVEASPEIARIYSRSLISFPKDDSSINNAPSMDLQINNIQNKTIH